MEIFGRTEQMFDFAFSMGISGFIRPAQKGPLSLRRLCTLRTVTQKADQGYAGLSLTTTLRSSNTRSARK